MKKVTIDIQCQNCRNLFVFLLPKQDFDEWKNGARAQDALPYLSFSERELLISQICGKCFDSFFEGNFAEGEPNNDPDSAA